MTLSRTVRLITMTLFMTLVTVSSYARDENEVVFVKTSDPAINQAIKKARSTLPSFFSRYKSRYPNVGQYKLKVVFSDSNGSEHFWVQPFRILSAGQYEGVLANAPRIVKGLRHGQVVKFTQDMITDWGYKEKGIQYGSFTVCALFKKMPQAQANYYRKNHGFRC